MSTELPVPEEVASAGKAPEIKYAWQTPADPSIRGPQMEARRSELLELDLETHSELKDEWVQLTTARMQLLEESISATA